MTLIAFLTILNVKAGIIVQEKGSTHLRWNIFAPKDLVQIHKNKDTVQFKTLNTELYIKLEQAIKEIDPDGKYITSIKTVGPSEMSNSSKVEVKLKSENVELFSFYKDRDKKLVVDFWTEESSESAPVANVSKPVAKPVKKAAKKKVVAAKPAKNVIVQKSVNPKMNSPYRDFRYGASFIWDYSPLAPTLKKIINLDRKTPEYFYKVGNRDVSKSEAQAHMQLTINLFRKKKWGLMYKSIKLFNKKYGEETEFDTNEFMKANAILRENFSKGNTEPVKMSISMFENILLKSKNYELRSGIYKYLIPYYIQANDHIKSLELTKKYYVDSKENHDYEESNFAAEGILYNLAKLKQIDKVQELLKEKTIQKILPKQVMLAYEMYTYLSLEESEKVIKLYEANEKSLVKPVHPVILYNVAEAYFRNSNYSKAAKVYDDFIKDYSFHSKSSEARIRIAQCWEIQEKNFDETIELYKNAINRSQNSEIGFEARIRYVALRNLRKKKVDDSDREVKVFLTSGIDNVRIESDLKKLLWQVRLRTFIVEKKYDEALAYLNALPLKSMIPTDRRVFESDGAEIVYGVIEKSFEEGIYANVIKAWDIYKDQYVDKVANDPQMNFLVANAYIRLGLMDGFDELYEKFSKSKYDISKTFPIWVERKNSADTKTLLSELQVIRNLKLKNWSVVGKELNTLRNEKASIDKLEYYQGLLSYHTGDWKKGADSFEKFLSSGKDSSITDPKEIAELVKAYTDCLYELGDTKKYQKVASALLSDTRGLKKKNEYMDSVREKVSYLNIELLAGDEKDASFMLMESKIKRFKEEFSKSIYLGRVNYLLGLALLNNKKNEEGREILEKLISEDGIDEHIKNLARSELSMLKIKERTL
ncbi:tetratricopeptide repeat protein [Halobacteriovorax marinus]|uniref:tetratricopeptide repeat protein n=1 Tax=Halobacteriovorax marinus TaxID=97084 RepID=UPI0015608D53|nr:tetratricopeptide repeat protein [Halobacteriovorax marinus]